MNLDIESLVFIYATLSHGSLVLLYSTYIKQLISKKTLYLMGHIFITSVMVLRTSTTYRDSLIDTVLGSIGHSCLLSFFVITTFIYTSSKYLIKLDNKNNNWLNIICIIGQIGMITIYNIEHINSKKNNKYRYNYRYLYIITFSLLTYFYYKAAFNKRTRKSILFYPLIMISILYLILLLNPVYSYIVTPPVQSYLEYSFVDTLDTDHDGKLTTNDIRVVVSKL